MDPVVFGPGGQTVNKTQKSVSSWSLYPKAVQSNRTSVMIEMFCISAVRFSSL